jgi:hypothetical protein
MSGGWKLEARAESFYERTQLKVWTADPNDNFRDVNLYISGAIGSDVVAKLVHAIGAAIHPPASVDFQQAAEEWLAENP